MSTTVSYPEKATEATKGNSAKTPANLKLHVLPPADFDARTASDSALKKYGLPQRPDAAIFPAQAAHWDNIFSKKITYITPEFVPMETLLPGVTKHHGPVDKSNNNNGTWSGSVVETTSADQFKSISGLFNVPDVAPPGTTAGTYWNVSWIGIDGYGTADVCQVGTVQAATLAANGTVTKTVYAWTEWYPQSWVAIANFPVSTGDTISALLCIQSPTEASFNMYNETTGTHTGFAFTAPAGTTLQGTTAEWIVERPGINGATSTLADFGEVYFDGATASTQSNKAFNAGSGILLNMVENNVTVSTTTVETATLIKLTSAV